MDRTKIRTIYSEIELLKTINGKNFIIYGAGIVAQALISYIEKYVAEVRPICIVTSEQPDRKKINRNSVHIISDKNIQWENTSIIVAAMEKKKYEMINTARNYSNNIVLLDDDFCMHLRHLCRDYSYDKMWIEKRNISCLPKVHLRRSKLNESLIRMTPQPKLQYMVLNILEHCNLRCKGCDHFSPLADKREIPLLIIESDIKRFSKLMEQDIQTIGIMGGEPLLHSELPDIMTVVRKNFPHTRIQIDTNGLLLLNQKKIFWEKCRENQVVIVTTKYPIKLDYDAIEQICKKNQIEFEYYGDTGENEKQLYKMVLDLEGQQEPREAFANCFHANNCVTLMEGKLYPCTVAPNIHIFNNKYGTHMNLCHDDYIDIYDSQITKRQVLDFLSKPIPFCRFCNTKQRTWGHIWTTSKQEMTEWI